MKCLKNLAMNSNSEYNQYKAQYINKDIVAKSTLLENIKITDKDVLIVENQPIVANRNTIELIESIAGLTPTQKKYIKKYGGEADAIMIENYFNTTKSNADNQNVLLIADTKSQCIANALILKEDIIPYKLSFEFLEHIINKFDFEVDSILPIDISFIESGFYIYLIHNSIYDFIEGESFRFGLVITVCLNKIEINLLYHRNSCGNLSISKVSDNFCSIYSLTPENWIKAISNIEFIIKKGFSIDNFEEKIKEAISTKASFYEIESLDRKFRSCLHQKKHLKIFDYPLLKNKFHDAIADIGDNKNHYFFKRNCQTKYNIWDIYNKATYFATHEKGIDNDKRKILQNEAHLFLMKNKYDLKAPFRIKI
ncbi:hypothetical protein PG291_09775 [Riemerella anatipestifer]|nr:hypothetical protein [Riemerella anatipestifer]